MHPDNHVPTPLEARIGNHLKETYQLKLPGLSYTLSPGGLFIASKSPPPNSFGLKLPSEPLNARTQTQLDVSYNTYDQARDASVGGTEAVADMHKAIGGCLDLLSQLDAKGYLGTVDVRDENPIVVAQYTIPTSSEADVRELLRFLLDRPE